MTKADLVEKIAGQVDLSKKDSEIVVNTVFRSIIDALAKGDKVELRGFGSFRIRDRKSRIGRNPKTGDRVNVPEKRIPFFKPGKNLKQFVNE
jgi:integration host factor subunit beta